jgi:hypothetical protein
MPRKILLNTCLLVVTVCVATACDSNDKLPIDDTQGEANSGDAGAACPADLPDFRAGKDGTLVLGEQGLVQARLQAASAIPPVRYENTWTIALSGAEGGELQDVEIVDACAFMPLHGHGAAPKRVRALAEQGQFELEALNLRMAGPWEIQLAVRAASLTSDAESFTSCDRRSLHPGLDYLVFHVCVRDD